MNLLTLENASNSFTERMLFDHISLGINEGDKIGVIGQRVGIENTNHFIRLFKDKTGVTPLYYRKATPIL